MLVTVIRATTGMTIAAAVFFTSLLAIALLESIPSAAVVCYRVQKDNTKTLTAVAWPIVPLALMANTQMTVTFAKVVTRALLGQMTAARVCQTLVTKALTLMVAVVV